MQTFDPPSTIELVPLLGAILIEDLTLLKIPQIRGELTKCVTLL